MHVNNNALFDQNMRLFRKRFPDIYQQIQESDCSDATLIPCDGNDVDIQLGGESFYNMGAKQFANMQVKEFWDNKLNRMFVPKPEISLTSANNDALHENFKNSILKKATEKGLDFSEKETDARSFYVVVLGVGLAEHLPILASLSKCRCLIVVERDIRFIHCSLKTFDWRKFLKQFRSTAGYSFEMAVSPDPQILFDFVNTQILSRDMQSFIDGFCLLQHNIKDDAYKTVGNAIFSNQYRLISPFGWAFDELNMIHNSFFTLSSYKCFVFSGNKPVTNLPAFIIGSGPSIDQNISTIKALADRAVIISCGSSLSIMLDNGIIPDFHCELENVIENFEILQILANRHDLSKIPLIASSTIYPDTAAFFEKKIIFFRKGLSVDPLFKVGKKSTLELCTPTVANTAVCVAREIGARDIYLFGVDLGSSDGNQHHSTDTPYIRGDADFDWEVNTGHKPTLPIKGNFGGTVFTHEAYLSAKQNMEHEVKFYGRNCKYYNCSDGVYIHGFSPLKPEQILLMNSVEEKENFVRNIIESFRIYEPAQFYKSWNVAERLKNSQRLQKMLVSFLDTNINDYETFIKGLYKISNYLSNKKKIDPEMYVYRGTIRDSLSVCYYLLTRVASTENRVLFSNIVRDEFVELINQISQVVNGFYKELEDPSTAKRMVCFDEHMQ